MVKRQKAPTEAEIVEQRDQLVDKATDLMRRGKPLHAIAQALQISRIQATAILEDGIERYKSSRAYVAEYGRAIESMRLERLMEIGFEILEDTTTPIAIRSQVIGHLAKVSGQRARLLGYEAAPAPPPPADTGQVDVLDAEVSEMTPKVSA